MPIKLRCQCGKTLNAPDSTAGKRVKCPGCGKAIRVPASGSAAHPKATAPRGQAKPAPSLSEDLGSLFDEEGFSATVEAVCPSCRAEMTANAVLCTKCGYHKESGEQLESHKTIGIDIDHGTLALEKAADDMVKEKAMQQELLKGAGMPWWALAMVIVIGGGGVGIAVIGVNSAHQETDVERPGVIESLLLLTSASFLFASAVCVLIIVIHAFKQSIVKGLLTFFTFPFYYLYHVFTNWKEIGKVFLISLVFGVVGTGAWFGSGMIERGSDSGPDDGTSNAFSYQLESIHSPESHADDSVS